MWNFKNIFVVVVIFVISEIRARKWTNFINFIRQIIIEVCLNMFLMNKYRFKDDIISKGLA